jgi:type II secretory pathway pseudopilin PulG
MKAWFKACLTDRRRAQSGSTLVELLVSVVIMGLALVIVVGTFSTGLIDSSVAKRNTAAQAVLQYELEKIGSSTFDGSAQPYSECFATDNPTAPTTLAENQSCPSGSFALRADVSWTPGSGSSSGMQLWTVSVIGWPSGTQAASPVSLYKANR